MSHYVVGVIADCYDDVEYMLEPYDESLEVEDSEDGYKYNPDAKWDWYTVGGRWEGSLKTKDGANVDWEEIQNIDFEKMRPMTEKEATRFWEIKVEGDNPLNEKEEKLKENSIYTANYYKNKYGTKEIYVKAMSVWSPFAFVDENGWHEPGEMGWWAIDNSTPDGHKTYHNEWLEAINNPDNKDKVLVLVDCHI